MSAACRVLCYHRSTYYRWEPLLDGTAWKSCGRENDVRRGMPTQVPPWFEERVVAFALGHPGRGPRPVSAQLALPMWGGQAISSTGVLKVLRRHGVQTRRRRLALAAGHAGPPEPETRAPAPPLHLEADQPGELVQRDCFRIGRSPGTKGRV